MNPLCKQQFLTHSLHETHLRLHVRHLEFEKEPADHHSYSRLKGFSRCSCTCCRTCLTHVLAPSAEVILGDLLEAVNQRDIFGRRNIFGPKFTSRSKLSPAVLTT